MSEQNAVTGTYTALQKCETTFKVTVFRKGKTKQVLFLEAGKDFVDTLFGFLLLPISTILHILSQAIQVKPRSGISSIYGSVNSSILLVDKQELLQPRPSAFGCTCETSGSMRVQRDLEAAGILRSPPPDNLVLPQDYFKLCNRQGCTLLSSDRTERCGRCKTSTIGPNAPFHDGPYSAKKKVPSVKVSLNDLVKNIEFIVTDNLEIIPSNALTTLNVLKKLDVASVDYPESNEITISITQILQLLHSALISDTCLNDVFGPKK